MLAEAQAQQIVMPEQMQMMHSKRCQQNPGQRYAMMHTACR